MTTSDEDRKRPSGSNADEWHLFLTKHLDNRASNNGLTYMALQICEAIDEARTKQVFRRMADLTNAPETKT
jgi:hypothetical protein